MYLIEQIKEFFGAIVTCHYQATNILNCLGKNF